MKLRALTTSSVPVLPLPVAIGGGGVILRDRGGKVTFSEKPSRSFLSF